MQLLPPIPKNLFNRVRHGYRTLNPALIPRRRETSHAQEEIATHLSLELKTPRLNAIHQHLWLAGFPRAARPLYRHKLLGRDILITEDPDEHLIWLEAQIFLKPLAPFLLDYDYWAANLCSDEELHKSACGMLLSYAWLIRHMSDLEIAKETGLLPKTVEWEQWLSFQEEFLSNIDLRTLEQVHQRYRYGELRLSRLNTIYRIMPPHHSIQNFMRGYRSASTWYNAFFERHFKWMLTVFAILSVLLSAFQVGVATQTLQSNEAFQQVSYGFSVAAIVAVVTGVTIVALVWFGLFWYYLLTTRRNDIVAEHGRRSEMSKS